MALSIQAQIAEAHRSEAERAAFAAKERARLELEELEKATAPGKPAQKAAPVAESKPADAADALPAPLDSKPKK